MMKGKIFDDDPNEYKLDSLTVTPTYVIEDEKDVKYYVLDGDDYLEIDTKLRAPSTESFDNFANIGDNVSFEYITWKGINVITKIKLDKLAKRIWY